MKSRKRPDLALMAQGINGIAELYAELSAKCTALEGSVLALKEICTTLQRDFGQAKADIARLQTAGDALGDEVMQEYMYGKRGDGDV